METTNVNLINTLSAEFTGDSEEVVVETIAPSNTLVELPAGFVNSSGALVKYAEVRELNGADEEELAKAASPGLALNTALIRGVVSLGDEAPTKKDFDTLLAGDRDAILLAIRKLTFGQHLRFKLPCGGCNVETNVVVDLDNDVEIATLDNPITGRSFSMETKKGTVVVNLPNGVTQKKIIESFDKSTPEIVTIILAGCIQSINDELSMGRSTALSLGIADREAIISEIATRSPGPRLGEVSKACEACGNELFIPLSLADLFRL
jgi:hypothetical protein